MGIVILPVLEEDIPTIARIELDAFKSHPRIPMLWPNGYTDDLYAFHEWKKLQTFRNPAGRLLKAVDEETGKIVGASEVTFALDPETNAQEEPMHPDEPPPSNWPKGGNWALRRYFTINSHKLVSDSFAGKPYIVVDILVVDSNLQGQGIGSKLLDWSMREADERGVLLGLESTPAGLALYKRHGFQEAEQIKADMRMFGWDQPYDENDVKRVWMIRRPQLRG